MTSESDAPPIEAAILDLDGVVTETALVHEEAWKRAFDGLLAHLHEPRAFTREDYLRYVDGRPRIDGVRAFLAARGITLPEGQPSDPPSHDSVLAIATLKNAIFHRLLSELGVRVYEDAVPAIVRWREAGLRTAIVTSSKNASAVLEAAGIQDLFEVRVDGLVGTARGLAGKPAPDYFLEGARLLGIPPARGMVLEDAVAGVSAAARGGFGLVVGVSRDGLDPALRAAGADLVVHRLTELPVRPKARERRREIDEQSRSEDATRSH